MKLFMLLLASVLIFSAMGKSQELNPLIKLEQEFSKLSVDSGFHYAMLHYAHDSIVVISNNAFPIEGKKALAKKYTQSSDSGYIMRWEATHAYIDRCGYLGYTYGIYQLTGNHITATGCYHSVWRKSNNKWKLVLDVGTEGLPE